MSQETKDLLKKSMMEDDLLSSEMTEKEMDQVIAAIAGETPTQEIEWAPGHEPDDDNGTSGRSNPLGISSNVWLVAALAAGLYFWWKSKPKTIAAYPQLGNFYGT